MQISGEKPRQADHEVEVEGLPVVRPNVAGIDLGSTQHWVCAPKKEGTGRDVAHFGATTPELEKMAEWLKQRNVESVAMEATGVYWIAPHEALERYGLKWYWWMPGSWRACQGGRRPTEWTVGGSSDCTVAGC